MFSKISQLKGLNEEIKQLHANGLDENAAYNKLKGDSRFEKVLRSDIHTHFKHLSKNVEAKVETKFKFNYDSTQSKHPDAVSEHAFDIFRYLKHRETAYPLSNYIAQKDCEISGFYRAIVVDWLIECQQSYCYTHETLYISIRLFDMYMSKKPSTPVTEVQLVAGTALFVASKFEEYDAISVKDLCDLCLKQYSESQFLTMEREMLRAIGCDLGFPLSYSFLRRFARTLESVEMRTLTLARFILEISVHFIDHALELPSKLAAACLVLALKKSSPIQGDWVARLEYYSGHTISILEPIANKLEVDVMRFKKTFSNCKAVVDKYSDSAFYEVASVFYK